MKLKKFLKRRLAEDEKTARAAQRGDGRWEFRDRSDDLEAYPWTVWAPGSRLSAGTGFAPAEARHMAGHDPARALREVAAARLRIELAEQLIAETDHPFWRYAGEQLLKLEAAPYADHPSFDPSWLPEAT